MSALLCPAVVDPLAQGLAAISALPSGVKDSGPKRSVKNRFNGRIETALSILPRRHASSQGAPHARPQIEAIGFGARAMRYASSSLPCATNWT